MIMKKHFGAYLGSIIIEVRSASYSLGQTLDAIPRKKASRMTSSSSFVAHFANNASVGLFALNAFVKDISCGVIAISAANAVLWQQEINGRLYRNNK